MRNTIIFSILVSIFIMGSAFRVKAQVSDQVKFIFVKEKGKVVKVDENRQKVVDFTISGLTDQTDLEKIQNQFRTNKLVISFNISKEIIDGSRKAKLVCLQAYKVDEFQKTIKSLGIKEIIIDNKTVPVDDIISANKRNKKAAGR